MLTTAPRGTKDILPGAVNGWRYVESVLRDVCREFNYQEIRTPIFEHTELFQRGIGDGTDVVDKEMYTFNDRSGRSITLRPENTAAVVRSFVENKLYAEPMPLKVFYIGPMFRYDRPQAGRMRQFHQFGVEAMAPRPRWWMRKPSCLLLRSSNGLASRTLNSRSIPSAARNAARSTAPSCRTISVRI